jgi:hypothetical protein
MAGQEKKAYIDGLGMGIKLIFAAMLLLSWLCGGGPFFYNNSKQQPPPNTSKMQKPDVTPGQK